MTNLDSLFHTQYVLLMSRWSEEKKNRSPTTMSEQRPGIKPMAFVLRKGTLHLK